MSQDPKLTDAEVEQLLDDVIKLGEDIAQVPTKDYGEVMEREKAIDRLQRFAETGDVEVQEP